MQAIPSLPSHEVQCVNALNAVHQEIRQALDAIVLAGGVSERTLAAKRLQKLQQQFDELAQAVQQQAQWAKQQSSTNARCIAHDNAATHKALRCIKLVQQAEQLDAFLGSRNYGRLHPRYTLNSSSTICNPISP